MTAMSSGGQTLIERKDVLRGAPNGGPDRLRYVEHFSGTEGLAFFGVCCAHDLEGVVAKRRESTNLDVDRETAWLKIKNRSYSGAEGRAELFEARV
jgi:ATP-dependent DNA ligase